MRKISPDITPRDFGKLKVRAASPVKQAEASIFQPVSRGFERMSHEEIIRVIRGDNLSRKRELSRHFVKVNGIYARAVNFLSQIYTWDWFVTPNFPFSEDFSEKKTKQLIKGLDGVLSFLDKSQLKRLMRRWSYSVCEQGCYYGYLVDGEDHLIIQDLPIDFCRSRFLRDGSPVVEMNMEYFWKITTDEKYRE